MFHSDSERAVRGLLRLALVCVAVVLVACVCIQQFGCAAGRGPNGEVIIGANVAKLVETPGQMLGSASAFLPPPWNMIAAAGGSLLLSGGSAYVASRKAKSEAADKKALADAEWQHGHDTAQRIGPVKEQVIT